MDTLLSKMPSSSWRIIFIGTTTFGLPTLKILSPLLVITAPDQGKKISPIKKYSLKRDLPIFQPQDINSPAALKKIKALQPALIITASYGQILGKEILKLPPLGCLNLHPSLLPKYRGPSPIQAALLNQDKFSGVSIILMDEEIDHGPIIAQTKIKIKKNETAQSLHYRLAQKAAQLLQKTLPLWITGQIKPREQEESQATYTLKLKKKDGKINFSSLSAPEIERKLRAYHPWPGIYLKYPRNKKKLTIKLHQVQIYSLTKKLHPTCGFFFNKAKNRLFAQCKEGILEIKKLQPASRKIMSGEEFIRGYLN